MEKFAKLVEGWKTLQNGLPYKWVVDYAAYSAFGTFELSDAEWANRDYIVNFKGNSELTTEADHQAALQKAIRDVSALVADTFGADARQLTFVCIPASLQSNTQRRFEHFGQEVCQACGMENAYAHFIYGEEGTDYTIDEAFFDGKQVLLFDDIIASGKSVCRFADCLSALGAHVVAAVALGKKISDGYNK